MSITPVTPVVEMLIGGVWTDITGDVRLDSAHSGGGIRIKRGTPNEGTRAEPTQVDFVLDNTGGKYSPKNELGPNYGMIGRNTPVRFAKSRISDDFGHPETDTWGRLPSWLDSEKVSRLGSKWRLTGGAARFDIASGTATITSGTGYSMATFGTYGDVEVLTRVKTSVRDSEFGIVMRLQDPALHEQDWESGIAGWTVSGGTSTLTLNTSVVHTGTTSGQLTVNGSPTTALVRNSDAIPVTPNRPYRARMWVRCSVAATVTGAINWRKADGTPTGTTATVSVAVTANTWTMMEVDGTSPVLAATAIYGPGLSATPPANGTVLLIDDCEFLENDNFYAYTGYITPGSPDLLRLGRLVPSNLGSASSSQTTNINTNEWWWMKAQMTGLRRRLKWWKDGTPEPDDWSFRFYEIGPNDGRLVPPKTGMVGLFAKDGTSTVTFDSIQVTEWRAHAEISELPPRWDLARSDQWVPISARGITRRLGQGRKTLESPVTLFLRSYTSVSRLWAPLEAFESNGTTVPNLAVGGIVPVAKNLTQGTPEQSGPFALPGVSGFADFSEDDSSLTVKAVPGAPLNEWSFLTYLRVPNAPASDILLYKVETSGSAKTFYVYLQTDRAVRVEARDINNASLDTKTAALYNGSTDLPYGVWMAGSFYVFSSGGTVTWAWNYHWHGSPNFFTVNGTFSGTAGEFLGATYFSSAAHTTAGNLQIAEIFHMPGNLPYVTDEFARAAAAYAGELAYARWLRNGDGIGVIASSTGGSSRSQAMGTQPLSKALDVMEDCGEVDDAIILEERDSFGLNYRARESMYNQIPIDLDIDLGHLTEPLEPTDDDQNTRNDVIVKRPNGGQARSIQTEGPLNVNNPEIDTDGVGVYDESPEMNYGYDSQLQAAANWRRSKGTQDVIRYPQMKANLNSECYDTAPSLVAALLSVDSGDMLRVTNREVSREPTVQLVTAIEEFFDQYDYTLSFTTKPGDLWSVGVIGQSTRVAAKYTTLQATFVTGTGTRVSTQVSGLGQPWVQPQNSPKSFPFDVMIGGARMRVHSTGDVRNSNPYVQSGLTGWTATNGLLIWTPDLFAGWRFGQAVGRAQNNSGGSATVDARNAGTVTVGKTYQASTFLRLDTTSTDCGVNLIWLDAGGAVLSSVGGSAATQTAANGWVHYSVRGVAPASAVSAVVVPYAVIGSLWSIFFVDARLIEVASLTTQPQTLSVEQVPINGVVKTVAAGQPVTVADPWKLAF